MHDGVKREATGTSAGGRRSNTASNIFALAAVVFGVLALILYLRNPGGGIAPVPTAAPGGNQIVNVTDALRAQDLDIQQPPGLFVPRGALDVPGQGIEIDGAPSFIFLYPDEAAAQTAAMGVDADDIVPERLAGTPTPEGERRLIQGSNVIVVVVGGSAETWQKVETAVASLA
jgi:hypothetical protein